MEGMRQNTDSRTVERELNARLLPVLAGLFGILYLLTGFRGWLAFFVGALGLWLLAAVWIAALARGLGIERKLHLAWAMVGEAVPEELTLVNKSRLPALWVEIVDETGTPEASLRMVSDVEPEASRRRHPLHLFTRRGYYTLGPTRLRTGDPFGIYTLTLRDRHSSHVLVLPPQLSLSGLDLDPGGWAGDRQRRRGLLEREVGDAGVRDYLPGDSLKRIHWRASAHRDALSVRLLESAASDDWRIFVDLDQAVQVGMGQDSTLELSIVLAASLVLRARRERRRVGLALAGPDVTWLEPGADPAHHWRMLQALAMAEAGRHSLADLLALAGPGRTTTTIVITPAADPAWIAAFRSSRRGQGLAALLVDPSGFGGAADQGRLVEALARHGIPFTRMPRSLLEQAYASPDRDRREPPAGTGRRYLRRESELWQPMD